MSGILQDGLLGFQLGLAIYVDRVWLIRLAVPAGLPVEDFPAGEKEEGNILRKLGEIRGGLYIDATRFLRVLLTVFRATQRRAMNHHAGLDGFPRAFDVLTISEITVGTG